MHVLAKLIGEGRQEFHRRVRAALMDGLQDGQSDRLVVLGERIVAQRQPGAMLETCGSAGKGASEGGCTFPVTES